MRPQPWHDEAHRMRADGASIVAIGEAVGKSATTVMMLFSPEYRAAQRANQLASKNRKYRRDAAFRAERQAYYRAWRAKQRDQHT